MLNERSQTRKEYRLSDSFRIIFWHRQNYRQKTSGCQHPEVKEVTDPQRSTREFVRIVWLSYIFTIAVVIYHMHSSKCIQLHTKRVYLVALRWRIHLQCRRWGFDPWVGKIPLRRAWQPTPVFLPGESHGQRSLVGYSPLGSQRVRHDWSNSIQNFIDRK